MDTQSKFNAEKYDLEGEWKCAFRPDVDHYQRIGLDPERQYSTQQIDEAYQARLSWWKARKKQRDKGEESNPLIKKVGPYIDDALNHLGQVSACLLDAEKKRAYDKSLEQSRNREKEAKLLGFIAFTLRDGLLTTTEKRDLLEQARELGVTRQRAEQMIWAEMARCGAREVSDEEVLRKSDAAQGGSRPTAIIDPPQLVVSQASFSLGTLRKGERRECVFATDNKGGGILQGNIEVSDPAWLKVSEAEITGRKHHQEIRVFVDTSSLNLGSSYTGRIDIHSNGGRAAVQIDLSVELEKVAVARYRTQLFWTGLLFGAALGVAVYGLISNTFTADVVARIAGLVGCVGIIAVCAQARGWGGGIGVFFLAWISGKILELLSMRAYSAAAWATIASSFLYLCARPLLVAKLSGNSRTRAWVAAGGLGLSASVVLLGIEVAPTLNPRPYLSATMPVEDKLGGSTIGSPAGIRWTHALGDRGAAFSAADSSRIEYPGLIPREGTLEFWIDVNGGYHYENGQFKATQNDAMIFSSDAQGGDVTWPGTTKLFVGRKGRVSFWMATNKYNKPSSPETEARNTKFRFGEWHAIGVSYGRQGQYIMLDGKLVASAPARTQTFGVAGNHQQPLDIPTIGETVSHFWSPHRYEGGFEGTLAAFRISGKQEDWVLAKGVTSSNEAVGASSIGSSGQGTMTEGIRTVDFSNFDYPSDCWKYYANSGFDNSIRVTNGTWAKGKNPDTGLDVIYFGTVGKPVFGDLTASGQEAAVVQTSCGFTAGNAGTDELFIFSMTEGKLQLLSKLSWSDWQTPNEIPFEVEKVEIQNGELLVTYRSGGSHAQPAWAATSKFKWDGSRFIRTGLAHSSLPVVLPSQLADGLSPTSDFDKPPTVIDSAPGEHSLRLNQSQQSAVSLFLASHPDVQMADCQTLGYSADACGEAYTEWKTLVLNAKAEVQYPYAAWGDFNRDGILDFVVPFFGRTSVNNWGWRKWYLVVFQGTPDGHFTPVVAAEDQWGACFDGILYHPVRQQIEYWCKSAGGSFRWDGSRYVAKRLIGD